MSEVNDNISLSTNTESTMQEKTTELEESNLQELKIGGGIALGIILLTAIIVPCVLLLPKEQKTSSTTTTSTSTTTTTTTTTTKTQIATFPEISTSTFSSVPTEDASTTLAFETTTVKTTTLPLVTDDYICEIIGEALDINICLVHCDSPMKKCTRNDPDCYQFGENCYTPLEADWSFCAKENEWKTCSEESISGESVDEICAEDPTCKTEPSVL
ncbi:Oidioi.mRNA.OKI2018_I69.chr1.g538.t1.cds [Oikopleura dioica]|uniref:Oidioi.mRNA.OKI2018_I69.chr1.g538.t1.cds n=1 Tax=Oikopleura dioica TaxID=34765 RepID=A0ABN7SK55_OIKDI|nr:Oidioi.mRNA.OKI2018_I69.chr1.g538.t1.cds [Oikopleura dioica]